VGLFVTLLAIAVRVVWIRLVPTRPVGDFAMYLESARHLVEHRSLDAEFIYMPGYVAMVAAVDALGGGLFAIKMIGVVCGGVTTAAVFATTRILFGRAAALLSGLLCALWPAGIAVASVTGTDMPAAALLSVAVWLLVRNAEERPLGAPAAFGFVLGLAAYVRAVALPLTVLALFHFRARGAQWLHAITRTAAACFVAFIVLLPWGIRNKVVNGHFSLTDSHGGHTALVGANPNSDGRYSRSLNRLFAEVTGLSLFAPPHDASDRAAYSLAKEWTGVDTKYAAGLLAAKADRLLSHERPLLYWPLYRESVLPEGSRALVWFTHHRSALEPVVDGFWYAVWGAIVVGVVAASLRRNWAALSLLPMPLALTVLYTVFFSEARYHLAILPLLFPFAGAGLAWLGEATHDLARRAIDRHRRPRLPLEAVCSALAVGALFWGWPRMLSAGERLRDQRRWAAAVCTIGGGKRVCAFRPTLPAPGQGPSPVRGVWDGFGLRLSATSVAAAARVELPAGSYRITTQVEALGPRPAQAAIELRAGTTAIARAPWPVDATPITLAGSTAHAGGKLRVELAARGEIASATDEIPTLWISQIAVEPDRH
jgi:4-amino-4-deoxy-L-arabinose transferase-like glycosyltransferase